MLKVPRTIALSTLPSPCSVAVDDAALGTAAS